MAGMSSNAYLLAVILQQQEIIRKLLAMLKEDAEKEAMQDELDRIEAGM